MMAPAPRNSFSTRSYSASTRSPSSYSSSSHHTDNVHAHASIDPLDLDDPAKMSPQAIEAELRYYGVQILPSSLDRSTLQRALTESRRQNAKGRQGCGGEQNQQSQPQQPTTASQHYNSSMFIAESVNAPHLRYDAGTSGLGNKPTFIPLLPGNRIPPQILDIIRTSADPSMKAINLDHRYLVDREVVQLSKAMESNRTVTSLSLRNCAITDEGISSGLAVMLTKNNTLVELLLDDNRVGTEGAASLSMAIITNETLAVLSLARNSMLMDSGVVYLIAAIEHNVTIRTLDVSNCGEDANAKGRASQIEEMLDIRQIDANFESLLERLIDDDFHVTGIDLSGRRIGNRGVVRLADALADNTQVRQLWLRGCNVGNDGARALASCLEQNMSIVDLFLANNDIGDVGLFAISDALASNNSTLVSLELENNDVSEDGLEAFLHALETNTSMLVANFENNPKLKNGTQMLDDLQVKLKAKLEGMNLTCFVVDPDVASHNGDSIGVVNLSVCSSFMPSTYRRAGLDSLAGTPANAPLKASAYPSNRRVSPNDAMFPPTPVVTSHAKKPDNNRRAPLPPQLPYRRQRSPPPPYPRQQQVQKPRMSNKHRTSPVLEESSSQLASSPKPSHSPRIPTIDSSNRTDIVTLFPQPSSPKSATGASATQQKRKPPRSKPTQAQSNQLSDPSESQWAVRQQSLRTHSLPVNSGERWVGRQSVRSQSLPVYSPPNQSLSPPNPPPLDIAHIQTLPLKTSTLGTIPEHNSSASGLNRTKSKSKSSSNRSKSPRSRSQEVELNPNMTTQNAVPRKQTIGSYSPVTKPTLSHTAKIPTKPLSNDIFLSQVSNMQKTMAKIPEHPLSDGIFLRQDSKTVAESIMQPQTQRNFNTALKNLLHLVELTKRANALAAARYSARHFLFCFVPISACIFTAIVLALTCALDISAPFRLGLALFSAFFSSIAIVLNFFQGKFGVSARASLHRSAKVEMVQVAFRLQKLRKYKGWGLSSSRYSMESRASAIRALHRMDVYVQAMRQCTPPIPNNINEACFLLSSRVKSICLKCPNAVKERLAYDMDDWGEVDGDANLVHLDMQIDVHDCLEEELRTYFFYPIFMPNVRDVVDRTIDVFFANPVDSSSVGTADLSRSFNTFKGSD